MANFDLTTPEAWYPVPKFPGYEISSHLRLRGHFGIRSWAIKEKGYRYALCRLDGRYRIVYLHHVVAELAHGPRPDGLYVLHRDDDRANNWPSNLYYGSQLQNVADYRRNGLADYPKGERRALAKLTDDRVREIRALAESGVNQCDIGRRFGVHPSIVNRILKGTRWAHVV